MGLKNFYIYKITELSTGLIYIGQRKCPENKTSETDNYMGSNKHIKKMIKEFGKTGYKKEILFKDLTQQECDKKEIELITELKNKRINNNFHFLNHHPGGLCGKVRIA